MRQVIFLCIFLIIFMPVVSSDVIITQEPEEIYSLGDTLNVPLKITTLTDLQDEFTLNLICSGVQTEAYKEYISMSAGEEIERNPQIPLIESLIGRTTGTCVLKAILGTEIFKLTEDFEISDYISISLKNAKTEASPEENIIVEGDAIKDNGKAVQGVAELKVIRDNESIIEKINTVKNGYFYLNFSLPKNSKAGQYLIQLNIYEKDISGEKTNKGFVNYNLLIAQIPTSLEIFFDEVKVEPGTDLRVKTILHDQTGIPIDSKSIITIKDSDEKILEQVEKKTNEFLEFPIKYNEPIAEWTIVAISNRITSEVSFNITEKKDVEITLVNRSVLIANKGNVPYCNESVLIKIGNDSINIDVCLDVDGEQEYILTAPEGEYQVEVISEGEEKISQNVLLTGRAIDVREISQKSFVRQSFVWIFLIAVLGFVAFLFFKKGYNRNFIGRITKKRKKPKTSVPLVKGSLLKTKNKAELSLSIKGDKQNISLICLNIKNLKEIEIKKESTEELLQKIVELVEDKKGYIYENNEHLFFIFAPINTKTFKNERTAIEVAQTMQKALIDANRLYKDKLDFGIGLNYGTIIAKKNKGTMEFMSMGTLITTAKRTANASKEEIILGEKINERLRADVKTEKIIHGKTELYKIKEIKTKGDHRNFLSNFVKRLEKEKKEQEEKEKSK